MYRQMLKQRLGCRYENLSNQWELPSTKNQIFVFLVSANFPIYAYPLLFIRALPLPHAYIYKLRSLRWLEVELCRGFRDVSGSWTQLRPVQSLQFCCVFHWKTFWYSLSGYQMCGTDFPGHLLITCSLLGCHGSNSVVSVLGRRRPIFWRTLRNHRLYFRG